MIYRYFMEILMCFSSFDLITQYKISLTCHLNVNFLIYYIFELKKMPLV